MKKTLQEIEEEKEHFGAGVTFGFILGVLVTLLLPHIN